MLVTLPNLTIESGFFSFIVLVFLRPLHGSNRHNYGNYFLLSDYYSIFQPSQLDDAGQPALPGRS